MGRQIQRNPTGACRAGAPDLSVTSRLAGQADRPAVREKVVAYITHGGKLLVFTHPHHSEAGFQVPAGTVEAGETIRSAVLREAREETGLGAPVLNASLGSCQRTSPRPCVPGRWRFHFYHLPLEADAPRRWRHFELHPSDGSTEPIEFELFWVEFSDGVPALVDPQGSFLHKLRL